MYVSIGSPRQQSSATDRNYVTSGPGDTHKYIAMIGA
jgi:hypothetical protein